MIGAAVMAAVLSTTLVLVGTAPSASADTTVYSANFETDPAPGWSGNTAAQCWGLEAGGCEGLLVSDYLVPFSNDTVTLTLSDLPPHTSLTLGYDLVIMRSWDGNQPCCDVGPDRFTNAIDGTTQLDTTFSNCAMYPTQNYPDSYDSGLEHPRFSGDDPALRNRFHDDDCFGDATYHLGSTIAHDGSSATITFQGQNLQDWADEGWALDNVVVSVAGTPTAADLAVSSLSEPPANASIGDQISVTDTTRNSGIAAGPSYTRYYLSADNTLDLATDKRIGSRKISSIGAGGSSVLTKAKKLRIPVGVTSGDYHLLACADAPASPKVSANGLVAETHEANNCRSSTGTVHVTSPNLVVTAASSDTGSIHPGAMLSFDYQIYNAGDATAGPSSSVYYLSLDTKLQVARDIRLGARTAGPIAPGGSDDDTQQFAIPSSTPPGDYHLIVCADGKNPKSVVYELNEKDNCKATTTTVHITSAP